MKFVYLGIFIIVTALHLYGSKKNIYLMRGSTKGLILLSLLGFYVESVGAPSYLMVIAILTSMAGDMFLIPHGVKWFTIGGIFFWISHFFFILTYSEVTDFASVPIWAMAIIIALFLIAVPIIFKKLKEHLPKPLFIPMFLYLITNGLMNSFAYFRLISCVNLGTIVTAVGAALFFVSDTSLFFVRFNKETKQKSHFLVMLTYSLGEFLIVLGFCLN